MVEATILPRGRYRLALSARRESWSAALPGGRAAAARQLADGRVHVRATDDEGVEQARFMLALDDDTSPFEDAFRRDPLLGPSIRHLPGLRPLRLATVAHAALRGVCGQLIDARRARAIERAVLRAVGDPAPGADRIGALAPAELCRLGLAPSRAAALVRLLRSLDVERLRAHPTADVLARLCRERGLGPWTAGVIALEGLGRYDHGLVGDLGLVKLQTALRGRVVELWETAELLQPYGRWQGLASVYLLAGFSRGLVPGASPDAARALRGRARRAA